MNSKRPKWVLKYEEIGFSKDWLDPVLSKYSSDFIRKTSCKYSPFKFVNSDILSHKPKFNIIQNLDIPKSYTYVYAIKFVYDTISILSKNIPDKDKDIYSMYEQIEKSDKFDNDYDFYEFYTFCRHIKYINIDKTNTYRIVDEAEDKYLYDEEPTCGSTWIVEYKGCRLKVKVIEPVEQIDENIIDPSMKVKVIESESSNINEKIQLDPLIFNNGKLLSY